MHKLFLIFAATTGYTKAIATAVGVMFVFACLLLAGWIYVDYMETSLKNRVLAQQECVMVTYDLIESVGKKAFLAEQQKLIDYKMDYDNLRESWLTSLILGSRPAINIKLLISQHTKDAYK